MGVYRPMGDVSWHANKIPGVCCHTIRARYAAFEPGFRRLRREINLPALLAF